MLTMFGLKHPMYILGAYNVGEVGLADSVQSLHIRSVREVDLANRAR